MERASRKVLLIDCSGRGHALADLFSRTDETVTVYYAPGTPAVEHERIVRAPQVSLDDPDTAIRFLRSNPVEFVFVAHIDALCLGYVDALKAAGVAVIGPNKAASRLESSKAVTKAVLQKYGIATARYQTFDEPNLAKQYIELAPYDVVVKADGLTDGDGAYVCFDKASAISTVDALMVQHARGDSGQRIVVEERLEGVEISFFALFDSEGFLQFPTALDYKRSDDGDFGINCEGMGSLSPHPYESHDLQDLARKEVFEPLHAAIQQEGLDYTGFIYAGAMLCPDGLKVLEINARFGDSEAEVVFPRVQSSFFDLCRHVLQQRIGTADLKLDENCYCNVVASQGAAEGRHQGQPDVGLPGWPYGAFETGFPISGIGDLDPAGCRLFFANVDQDDQGRLITTGGRVLHVVGTGPSHDEAIGNAYTNIKKLAFKGLRYRHDIGVLYDSSQKHKSARMASGRRR